MINLIYLGNPASLNTRVAGQIGAGIQVPPNATRILRELGVLEALRAKATEPAGFFIHRWEDGAVIGRTHHGTEFKERFGGPYLTVHRGDYHRVLRDEALRLGIEVRTGMGVSDYRSEEPALVLADETVINADLVVAVDGRICCSCCDGSC